MNNQLLYLFTRTPLHVGAGASVGAVDMPIQREIHTGYPIIPGSAIKGVIADFPKHLDSDYNRTDLGISLLGYKRPDDSEKDSEKESEKASAGGLSFSEAKILAFPVRSARGSFAWVTCPHVLERWSAATHVPLDLPSVKEGTACFSQETLGDSAILEEYVFQHGTLFECEPLFKAIDDSLWTSHASDHLALIDDDSFAYFCRNGCEVVQHVRIDDETGTAVDGALFNQENVPAETLFFSVITELKPGLLGEFALPDDSTLQVGGNRTTGLGFCHVELK